MTDEDITKIIQRIEQFQNDLLAHKYKSNPTQGNIQLISDRYGKEKSEGTLFDNLSDAIASYHRFKNDEDEYDRNEVIHTCMDWINKAMISGAMELIDDIEKIKKERDDLKTKFDDKLKENEKFVDILIRLVKQLERLGMEVDDSDKKFIHYG